MKRIDITNACNVLDILSNKKVLCVEDEEVILSNIVEALELVFDKVIGVKDGLEAMEEIKNNVYDVLMLDISIPHIDGLAIAKEVRQVNKKIPIIILSAHAEQEYLWRAIELKITKYLTKPYDKKALVNALEEVALELVDYNIVCKLTDDCIYDYCTKTLSKENQIIHLPKSESKLLEYFLKRPNQAITYEYLFDYMWDFDQPSKEAIKTIIKELRKKIDNGFIKNLYGIGYICEI